MSKIIGVTVGTPLSVSTIKEKLKPVTSVNGIEADENGNVNVQAGGSSVQSDWNVNDVNDPAYVKNRTHYSEVVLGDTQTWDGAPTDVVVEIGEIFGDGRNMRFYKVSDVVLTEENCANGITFRSLYFGQMSEDSYSAEGISRRFDENGVLYEGNAIVISVPTDNYYFQGDGYLIPNGATFPEAGIYFGILDAGSRTASITVQGMTTLRAENCKTIPDKYFAGSLVKSGSGAMSEVFNGQDPAQAPGSSAHAEGMSAYAVGDASHAEGAYCGAEGAASHAEGFTSWAYGNFSHAEGWCTSATNYASHAQGKYNKEMTAGGNDANIVGDAMVIGNGTNTGPTRAKSNAFRVTFAGETYGLSAFNSSGADYAEFFEWADLNPNAEDRVGYFVTLDGKHIRIAKPGDYILGIVSGQPCIIGNSDEDWLGRWEHDEFGRFIKEDVETPVTEMRLVRVPITDKNGNQIGKMTKTEMQEVETGEVIKGWRYKANPNYDPTQPYIERKDRQEWDCVGMLGVLSVRDDGSCEVNGFCTVADGGIATKADSYVPGMTYRVIERVSENVVKVVFR